MIDELCTIGNCGAGVSEDECWDKYWTAHLGPFKGERQQHLLCVRGTDSMAVPSTKQDERRACWCGGRVHRCEYGFASCHHDPPYRRTMFGVTDPLTLNQAVIGAGAAMLTGFVIHGLPPLSFEHKHYHKVDSCFSQHLTETGTRY